MTQMKCPFCGKKINPAAEMGKRSAKGRHKDYYKDLARKRWDKIKNKLSTPIG